MIVVFILSALLLSGEAAQRINPTSKEQWLHRHRRAERSYPTPKVRDGGREEQPHVKGAASAWAQEGQEELLHV